MGNALRHRNYGDTVYGLKSKLGSILAWRDTGEELAKSLGNGRTIIRETFNPSIGDMIVTDVTEEFKPSPIQNTPDCW